jgi:acetyl-CoA C-acetyltransferase
MVGIISFGAYVPFWRLSRSMIAPKMTGEKPVASFDEQLGFSPPYGAKEDIEAGTFTLEGELPVNTDGGLKCFGHPLSASGLRMVYEVYKQLQGKAGPRQIKNASIGLTHNVGGQTGYLNAAVLLFGKRDS